jgi:hypothetical protein
MRNITIAVFSLLLSLTFAAKETVAGGTVQHVIVCSLYGAAFFYIPGTDSCLNPDTGDVRTATAFGVVRGVSRLAGRVAALEGNVSDLQAETAALQSSQEQMQTRFDADFRDANDGNAIASALQDPYLNGSEHFGVKVNWGTFSGSNALGVTFAGVVAEQAGARMTVSGGAAFTNGNVGGHAGLQLSW